MILNTARFKRLDEEKYLEGYISQSSTSINYTQEWTRSLNPILFDFKDIIFENTHYIHDSTYNLGLSKQIKPTLEYSSKVYNRPYISGVIDAKSLKDNIYCLVEDKGNGSFLCEKPNDLTTIVIHPHELKKDDAEIKGNIYPGKCFRYTIDGSDKTILDVTIPEQKFNEILDYISNHSVSKIRACVLMESFTNKNDDSFSDPSDSKDIFYEDWSLALLGSITTTSNLAEPNSKPQTVDEFENDQHLKIDSNSQLTSLSAINKSLKNLSIAVWILITLIAYVVLK